MEKYLKYLILTLGATFSLTFTSCGDENGGDGPEVEVHEFYDGDPVPDYVKNDPEKYGFVDVNCWSVEGTSTDYEYCSYNPQRNLCFLHSRSTFVKLANKFTGNLSVRVSSYGSNIWRLEDSYYFQSDGYWKPDGIIYVIGETEPQYVDFVLDGNTGGGDNPGGGDTPGGGNNGGDNTGGGNNGGNVQDEWESFDAPGILPYWYCPSDGTTIPSNPPRTTYRAFRNKNTGAYKIIYASDEYRVNKGYNKITIDQEYHSVWVSNYGGFWKTCIDYCYLEVTI